MKPALTAEEWEALRKQRDANPLAVGAVAPVEMQTASSLHGLIAFMLDGQPFGFTREDVTAMRELHAALDDFQTGWLYNYGQPSIDKLKSITDRIESLLPPEPPRSGLNWLLFWHGADELISGHGRSYRGLGGSLGRYSASRRRYGRHFGLGLFCRLCRWGRGCG